MDIRAHLALGHVIPAHPLALDANRRLDERHQRALTRYYVAAGAGGIAVGVHTTQFAIRDPRHGLLEPVLALAAETADEAASAAGRAVAKVAGVCGDTSQALGEARLARDLAYDAALLSLGGWDRTSDDQLLAHCRAVSEVIPLFGFYLQPAAGGRPLGYAFWRAFAELPQLVAIKIAPFDRYATLDVVRAMRDAGRADVALYTGNDDNIVVDLLTPFPGGRRIVGGLLGQWAVWTRRAVEMLAAIRRTRAASAPAAPWLATAAALTDANGAIFDAAHGFAGCIPGIHEVLCRQGLLASTRCLDEGTVLSPGQREEIDRVLAAHPELRDDDFVRGHLDDWLH